MGFVLTVQSADNLLLSASISSLLCSYPDLAQNSDLHSDLHPNRKSSRDVEPQYVEAVPQQCHIASSFGLCCEVAVPGKLGGRRAGGLDCHRAAQPGTPNQMNIAVPGNQGDKIIVIYLLFR